MLRVTVAPSTDPTASPGDVELVVKNASGKDVVAYSVDVTTLWNGGASTSSGTMRVDLAFSIPSVSRTDPATVSKYDHIGLLRAGDQMLRGLGGLPMNATGGSKVARVLAVVFDDNTSGGDRTQIEQFFSMHADAAAELESELQRMHDDRQVDLRSGLNRWREEFTARYQASQTGKAAATATSGQRWAQGILAQTAAQLGQLMVLRDGELSAWFEREYAYHSEQARSLTA